MSKMNMTYSEAIVFCRYSHLNLHQNRPMACRVSVNQPYCLYWTGVTILMTDVVYLAKAIGEPWILR